MANDLPANHPYLPERLAFDPAADFEQFLQSIPGRWVVYLLCDKDGRPFQLLSVKNLRASLANRLCEYPADEKTRSIPYRQVVRQIAYRRVDSAAEAGWVYAQLASELFPDAYRKLMANWQPWFVQVDPDAKFPRWQVTDCVDSTLLKTTFGPIATKEKAQKWVETIEDAFDLCRYHHILVQAPAGLACAYKQMHKCPAPCDGSISMAMYHLMIERSIQAIRNPEPAEAHERRMRQAAAELRFELAGKIKEHAQQLKGLLAGPYTQVRPVSAMRYIAVLRAGRAKVWRLMLLSPGRIELLGEWSTEADLARLLADIQPADEWNEQSPDRLTFVCRRMLYTSDDGVLTDGTSEHILAAAKSLSRRKANAQSTDEGVEQESA